MEDIQIIQQKIDTARSEFKALVDHYLNPKSIKIPKFKKLSKKDLKPQDTTFTTQAEKIDVYIDLLHINYLDLKYLTGLQVKFEWLTYRKLELKSQKELEEEFGDTPNDALVDLVIFCAFRDIVDYLDTKFYLNGELLLFIEYDYDINAMCSSLDYDVETLKEFINNATHISAEGKVHIAEVLSIIGEEFHF